MVFMSGKKCQPGCDCSRHNRPKDSFRSGSTKCAPGCSCGRHKRALSDDHRANIAKANAARKGESHKCPEGCTCRRHRGYHFGGSQKGRKLSDRGRENISIAAKGRQYSEAGLEALRANRRAQNSDPEFVARRLAGLKNYWQNVVTPEEMSRGVKRSSRAEYVLAPYLEALGYLHNEGEGQFRVGRRTPDFIDPDGYRVFEYFGTYWHPDPEEEVRAVDFYAENGLWATILWEDRVLNWIDDHKGLVSEEQHAEALRVLSPLRRHHPDTVPSFGDDYVVYQHEWEDHSVRPIIESQVRNLQGKATHRVGARQCTISDVSTSEASQFLDDNHLQGRTGSSVRLGLFYGGELMALMTFIPPRTQKQMAPVEWELVRYAVRRDHSVPGGASRLFKHFIAHHNPASIVSYSDKAKTTGNMYPILGFTLVNESAPGYVWWNGRAAKKRYECMAYKLKAKYANLPGIEAMSEAQIMTALGYTKVPNKGNKVWVWRATTK